jgi:hypothetical protein
MAGRGPAPKPARHRRGSPERGDWQPSPDGGWQHELPGPPPGISPAAAEVWGGWFRSWWAGNWTTDDLPTLRLVIRLWDRVDRGDIRQAAELRQWMDSYGLTPKGRQDRRWVQTPPARRTWMDGGEDPYAHLRASDPDHPRHDPYGHVRPGATTAPTAPTDPREHP